MKDYSEAFILTTKTNFEKMVDLKVLCNFKYVKITQFFAQVTMAMARLLLIRNNTNKGYWIDDGMLALNWTG